MKRVGEHIDYEFELIVKTYDGSERRKEVVHRSNCSLNSFLDPD
jgi:hypothetical protein